VNATAELSGAHVITWYDRPTMIGSSAPAQTGSRVSSGHRHGVAPSMPASQRPSGEIESIKPFTSTISKLTSSPPPGPEPAETTAAGTTTHTAMTSIAVRPARSRRPWVC